MNHFIEGVTRDADVTYYANIHYHKFSTNYIT